MERGRVEVAVAAALLVVAGGAERVGADANAGSLSRAVEQQALAVAPGARRVAPPKESSAPRADWIADLEGGRCYCFSGGGGPGVRRLSLALFSPTGTRVAEAHPSGPWVTLTHCPSATGPHRVRVTVEGAGPWVVGEYGRPAGAPPLPPTPVAPPPPAAVAAPPPAAPYGVTIDVPGARVTVGGGPWFGGAVAPPQECRMGADGVNACGYGCRIGADGHAYCSSVPGGRCALNADGSYTCPQGPGAPSPSRAPRSSSPFPEKAGRGEACEHSTDCGFGLFCRDGECD